MTNIEIQNEAEKRLNNINIAQLQHYFENIPERHHKFIEKYFQEREVEKIGRGLLLAVLQQITEEIANGE